jgi:hypothetical protein
LRKKIGICSGCSKEKEYHNAFRKLCAVCNEKRLSEGKAALRSNPVKSPKKAPLRNRSNKNGLNKVGQAAVFNEIWHTEKRVSFICGTPLGNEAHSIFFFHVLPKGKYPAYRTKKENIILTTAQQHRDWHSKSWQQLLAQDARWQKVFDKYNELKKKYFKEIS